MLLFFNFTVRPRLRHEDLPDQVRGRKHPDVRDRSGRKSGRASLSFVPGHGKTENGGRSQVQGNDYSSKLRLVVHSLPVSVRPKVDLCNPVKL